MPGLAVLFGTRHGHARAVAERVARVLREQGADAALVDLARQEPALDAMDGVIVVASAHTGHYEREVVRFVRRRREALAAIPNAFLGISLSQAGVQRQDASAAEHAKFATDVDKLFAQFVADTGWQPRVRHDVAGALLYTQYGWPVRLILRRIARLSGGSTDTSRDHDYTDWTDLDRFAVRFAQEVNGLRSVPPAGHAVDGAPVK